MASVYTHITKIPRNQTEYFSETINQLSLPSPYTHDIYISQISVTIDTTSLYNIREVNTIRGLTINPGYYKIDTLRSILNGILEISDISTKVLQTTDFSNAPSIKRIFFIETNIVEANTIINRRYDISGGYSVIRVYSNMVDTNYNRNSLVDIPIYCTIGLDNTLNLTNLAIPINLPYNCKYITFWLRDIYDNPIILNSDVYISFSITCIKK